MKIIPRTYYVEKIKPYIDKGLIKVLTGQRRVGKSCVMQCIAQDIQQNDKHANIIYINKEDFRYDSIKDAASLVNYVESKLKAKANNYLFIDEIQDIEQFEKALRSFQANNQCDIFCSGSNAKILSGELATYLAGRYIAFTIHSLNYNEFLHFHQLKDEDESFMQYLQFGGMPHLLHLGLNSDLCNEYLRNIYSTIFLKDIVSRENIRNVVFLEKLLQFTADNIGSLLSAWSISKYLKSQKTEVNHSVIINYLKAMCNAFIINKVSRYDIAGKKIFENNEKYYFEDLGIRNVLVGMNFARDINKLLENLVYQHLKISGYEVFVGKYNDKEIDFIGLKQGKTIYVQVAYMIENHTTETREFGNLESISDNYPKYVISMDKVGRFNDYNGIYHLNIRDFLLKQL